MRRPAVIALLAALVLLGGCRTRKLPPDASATTQPPTTETTQPTTTTTLNLAAPPTPAQLQDPAYWNAILAALNHVSAEAFRDADRRRSVEPAATEALRQVYGSVTFPNQYDSLVDVSAGRVKSLLIPPGDPVASVTSIVKASGSCVALTAILDYTKVNSMVPTSPVAVKLLPRGSAGAAGINPTPWIIEEQFVIETPDDGSRLCAD